MAETNIETHPFKPFVPKNAKYLILGSFTGRFYKENSYDWYYGTKRNQFWSILELAYNTKLTTKEEKQELFETLGIALTDIIYKCERKLGNNLDMNLTNITYNTKAIAEILKKNKIQKVYFTSRFVEKHFSKVFRNLVEEYNDMEFVTLPSPSPRYAQVSLKDKAAIYKSALPTYKK